MRPDQTGSDVVDEKMCARELQSWRDSAAINWMASKPKPYRHRRGHFLAEVSRICGSAKPVDLSVVRVGMMNQLVALHQMQQVSGVQKEYDWPKQLPQSKYNMADAGHLENRYNVIFPRRMSDLDETRQPDAE